MLRNINIVYIVYFSVKIFAILSYKILKNLLLGWCHLDSKVFMKFHNPHHKTVYSNHLLAVLSE